MVFFRRCPITRLIDLLGGVRAVRSPQSKDDTQALALAHLVQGVAIDGVIKLGLSSCDPSGKKEGAARFSAHYPRSPIDSANSLTSHCRP